MSFILSRAMIITIMTLWLYFRAIFYQSTTVLYHIECELSKDKIYIVNICKTYSLKYAMLECYKHKEIPNMR